MKPIHQANDNLESYLKSVEEYKRLIDKKIELLKKIRR